MSDQQSAEVLRRQIAGERQALANAVTDMRDRVTHATDFGARLRLSLFAPIAFGAGFVLSGGIGATMRYFARRGRDR
jgi:hypothetical protein